MTHDDFGAEPPQPTRPQLPPRRAARARSTIVVAIVTLVVVVGVIAGLLMWRVRGGSIDNPEAEAAPTTTLTPRSGGPEHIQETKVGARTAIRGIYGSGTVMVTKVEWSDKGDLPPGPGRKYLNIELRYEATDGVLVLSKNQYAVYDMAKKEYLAGIGAGKDPLPDRELRPTDPPVSGWVSFEVPVDQMLLSIADEGINPLVILDIPKP